MIKHFDCQECGGHGKLVFKDDDEFLATEVAYCPFCGGDIYQDEKYEEQEDQ